MSGTRQLTKRRVSDAFATSRFISHHSGREAAAGNRAPTIRSNDEAHDELVAGLSAQMAFEWIGMPHTETAAALYQIRIYEFAAPDSLLNKSTLDRQAAPNRPITFFFTARPARISSFSRRQPFAV